MSAWLPALLFSFLLLCGCPTSPPDDDTGDDDTVEGCHATQQAADRDRLVVVALPYDDGGGQAQTWAALTLTEDGDLIDDGVRFEMGRAPMGEVVFTRDGQVGLVAQDDGTVGVFHVSATGEVTAVHAAYTGDFYASAVLIDPSGEWATLVDGNWTENGGGLYRVSIDCDDGHLEDGPLVRTSKAAADLLPVPGRPDRVLLVAEETPDASAGDDVHLLTWDDPVDWRAGSDAFGDDEAIVADATVTADGAYVLMGDYSAFSGIPNRVAVAALDGDTLLAEQVLPDVEDPVAMVASPWDDGVLVLSGYGDALIFLGRDDGASPPFTDDGEPDYVGASPQLPGAASLLSRGSLEGLVAVSENQGVRLVLLPGSGEVEDWGLAWSGSGMEFITGAIGVQP